MTIPGAHGMCVFDEQGAGKTVTFIFAFDLLVARDEADVALVIAPKSMVPEWPADLQQFKGDLYSVSMLSGSRSEKFFALCKQADFIVTNFETAVSMEAELCALLRQYKGRAVLAIDESFFIKNPDAKRTHALRRLREWCKRAYVLCGTPAPNMPHDLIEQFNFIDFGLTFEGLDIPKDRTDAVPIIRSASNERGQFIRHLKRDVLPSLPGKRFETILVQLQPQQQELYKNAINNLVVDLQAIGEPEFKRNLTSFLARRTALLQICSNPSAIAPGYNEVPAKLIALEALLNELISNRGEKVVVWSFFRASIDGIINHFRHLNPLRYDGTVTDVTVRRKSVQAFQEDPGKSLFVGNPAAAGAGLTLHKARYAIYESLSNQAAHYLQSLDRIHRRGQTRPVEYRVLLCERTIELREYETLTMKEQAAQGLMGDRIDQRISRDVLLREALDSQELLGDEPLP